MDGIVVEACFVSGGSCAALHILTAPNMPKRAYLEDVIERIVQLARFQLQHSIYPAYDPVYRSESNGVFQSRLWSGYEWLQSTRWRSYRLSI